MNNYQALVDQIVQNLAFEVEAVPRNKSVRTSSITQSTPLNVKIKVRKKDEIHTQLDLSSDTNDTSRAVQKVRLVNSDRTIMTFDVFMEADFEKKPQRKLHKHIFEKLRPGICLGAVDDDEYPYLPSSSYSANITEPSTATRSDGTLKQTFTLSKNAYQTYPVATQPGEHKWLFGKCRPGGCLDPPFSEEKYSYKPSTETGPEQREEELEENEDVECQVYSKIKPTPVHNEEVQSNGRHSSIFDSGLFKKKRKSSDKSTNTKLPDTSDSIVDLYQVDSVTNSVSTHSNSIITYPPKIRSDPRISHDKTVKSREHSEDKSRKSFNDHSEPLFVRPKGVNHVKEKDTLNPSDYPKQRSPDATDLRNSHKEPFKMPVPLPIPIPVPIPLRSNKRHPEIISTNDDSFETRDDNANVTELVSVPDQELHEEINSKGTDILPLNLRDKTSTSKIDDKPAESSKPSTFIPSKVEEPTIPDEIYDQDLSGAKLQPVQEIDSENNITDTAQIIKKSKTQPLKMPIPVPFSFSEPNLAAAVESKTINDNSQISDIKLPQPKQPVETKISPPTIKDTNLVDDSEDKQTNIDLVNRSEENESIADTTPNSQCSEIKADAIPQNYLRTRGNFSDQIINTENSKTKVPIITENIKRDSKEKEITEIIQKPPTQNDIKDKDTTAPNYTEYLRTRGSLSDQVSDTKIPVPEAPITTENIKRDLKEKDITEIIEKPVTQNGVKDKDTTAPKYIEENLEIPEMDTHQIIGSPNTDERKDFQRISISKLPVLQKNIYVRNDSADKHLYNLEYEDTDISNDKDEKHTSSLSHPENETDAVNGETSEPYSDKEDTGEITKSSKDHKIGSNTESQTRFIKEENMNFITAPVIVDNTKLTSNFGSRIKDVHSEIDLFGKPIITGPEFDPSGAPLTSQIISKLKKFDDDGEKHSTISSEVIGTKSVIYDEDGLSPSTSVKKNTEISPSPDKRVTPIVETFLSSIQSTCTLKSALKKDTISVDLGFYSYLNDKNERILRTFDTGNAPTRSPNDSVTVLKSQIKISSNEIRIPVDSEHDMSIQIKKTNANQRVSISESGFVKFIDNGRVKKQLSPMQCSDVETRSSETKANENVLESGGAENATSGNLIDYYEQELVPLQLVIKNLRDEIDVLATQQIIFKDKLFCPNKSKLPRMVHTNKKCFGCVRKQ